MKGARCGLAVDLTVEGESRIERARHILGVEIDRKARDGPAKGAHIGQRRGTGHIRPFERARQTGGNAGPAGGDARIHMPQLVDGDVEAEIRGRLRGAAVDAGIEMSAVDAEVLEGEAIGNAAQRACGRDSAAQKAVDGRRSGRQFPQPGIDDGRHVVAPRIAGQPRRRRRPTLAAYGRQCRRTDASAGMLASQRAVEDGADPTRPVKPACAVDVSMRAVSTLATPSRSKEPRDVTDSVVPDRPGERRIGGPDPAGIGVDGEGEAVGRR